MNKLVLLLFAVLFISFASATAYEQSSDSTFTVSCEFVNCSDGSILLTIVDPDGSLIIDNQTTTKKTGYVSYDLNATHTAQLGTYQYFLSSDNDYYSSSFEITPNGETPTTAKAFFYIGLLVLLIVFLIIAIFSFIHADQIWMRTGSSGVIYVLLIAISFIAWNMSANFLTSSPFLIDFLRIIFLVLIIGFFPFLLILFAYGIWMMLQLKEIQKLQDQGYSIDEASDRVNSRRKFK